MNKLAILTIALLFAVAGLSVAQDAPVDAEVMDETVNAELAANEVIDEPAMDDMEATDEAAEEMVEEAAEEVVEEAEEAPATTGVGSY